MAVDAPEDGEKIIPLGDGYGDDPYNRDAVLCAIATIREACRTHGHRCLVVVDPVDGEGFTGFSGSLEWLHFIGGRMMRLAMDEHHIACDMEELDWHEAGDE